MSLLKPALAITHHCVRSRLFSKQTFFLCIFVLMYSAGTKFLGITEANVWQDWLEHTTNLDSPFEHSFLFILSAILYSCSIIRDEFDNKTITYLFIRPIPKWLIAISKVFGAVLLSSIPVVLFLLLHSLILGVSLLSFALPLLFQQLFFCSLFCLMSFILRHPILWAILWITMFSPDMPGASKLMSLQFHQNNLYKEAFRNLEVAPISNEIFTTEVTTEDLKDFNNYKFPERLWKELSKALSKSKAKKALYYNVSLTEREERTQWFLTDEVTKNQFLLKRSGNQLAFYNTVYQDPNSYFPETTFNFMLYGMGICLFLICFLITFREFKLGTPETNR